MENKNTLKASIIYRKILLKLGQRKFGKFQ